MKYRNILFAWLTVLLPLYGWAGNVSETEALRKAQAFLKQRGVQWSGHLDMRLATKARRAQSAANAYYVFNVGEQQGFVIVSGDDRMVDILGYADNGAVHDDSMPDGLRYLLEGYASQMDWLDSHPTVATNRSSVARSAISPLVQTRWNQGTPYNKYCPYIDYYDGEGKHYEGTAVTGCVATSMAQVMYYHQHPTDETTDIPGYTARNGYSTQKALEPTTFDWNNMTTTYSSSDTGTAADAVAELMQYCGWSLQMNYNVSGAGGSSAYNASIPGALNTYFGYDGGVRYAQRRHYSYEGWINLIYAELAAKRPVVLGGQSAGGGHSFVCDGYDATDYFHINWGWGGSSDGYYRLSALNPYEQGIGGSSTLDGFSFGQDAVIGIKPYTSVRVAAGLSLEYLQFDATGSTSSQVVNRDNATDAFSGINIYYAVCSYLFGINNFDYKLVFCNAEGDVLATWDKQENSDMEFNKDNTSTLSNLSTPENIADGTYYIKVLSRASGTENWLECDDCAALQMTAVVSGNTMTITAPVVSGSGSYPTFVSMTVNGNLKVGYEQEVVVSLEGGDGDYHGDVVLRVNGVAVMGKSLDIPAGETVEARYVYTPSEDGDNVLTLWNAKKNGTQIGSANTVNIAPSDASNTQEISVSPLIANLDANNKLYGCVLRVTATVTNPSTTNSYASRLNCSLRTYDSAEIDDYASATVQRRYITIGKKGTTDVTFEYTGLELGKFYCLRFTYTQGYDDNGESKTQTAQALITDRYEMAEGYLAYKSDGSYDILPKPDGTLDAGDAVCLDLTHFETVPSITTSSNPNCVYLLASDAATPSSLSGRNVVKGTTAESIALTDGNDFFTPVAFTANDISYTRNFTLAAAGTSGWNTLMLPFTVSSVTCDLGTVDWFRSDTDTGKNFWLKTLTGDADGTVYFDHAATLSANTPYIIAVPGNTWGAEWQMTGKDVVFRGTGVTVAATADGQIGGNNYEFRGTTVSKSVSDVYALNAAGSKFVKTASVDIPAFRAWINPVSISSLTLPSLAIGNGEVSGIRTVSRLSDDGKYHTLDGRQLNERPAAKGIYIYQGKKIIIK